MSNQEFKVWAGVKLEPRKHVGNFAGRPSKYPFDQLDVGDLLVIPGTSSKSFGGTVRAAEKKTGFFFSIRTGPANDETGQEVIPAGAVGVQRIATKPARKTAERTPEQKAASAAKAKATRLANQQLKKAA